MRWLYTVVQRSKLVLAIVALEIFARRIEAYQKRTVFDIGMLLAIR